MTTALGCHNTHTFVASVQVAGASFNIRRIFYTKYGGIHGVYP